MERADNIPTPDLPPEGAEILQPMPTTKRDVLEKAIAQANKRIVEAAAQRNTLDLAIRADKTLVEVLDQELAKVIEMEKDGEKEDPRQLQMFDPS
jgi:hypothetical protein